MPTVYPDEVGRYLRLVGPQPDETLREMDAVAAEIGFPHVGPEVGSALRLLARLVDAKRVFEFGSGFGYSAYWIADALPDDGEIVLTEFDEAELEMAPEFLAAGGYDYLASYELGDALETVERYEGPFDLVLIDHQKTRYAEAFETVETKVPAGGVIVADNVLTGPVDVERIAATFAEATGREWVGETGPASSELETESRGVARYLEAVVTHPDFETVVVPLGEGISVSYRRR